MGTLSKALFVALCPLALPWTTIRERALLIAALALTGVLFVQGGGLTPLVSALGLGAYFGTFIILLTVMKEAAERPGAILAVGHYLTAQPPGQRFLATALGSHVLGVFLNFGAVSPMSPLIRQSAVTADGHPDPMLERRQLSALIRGFTWILLWAPPTLSQAVLLSVFPQVRWIDFALLGFGTAMLMVAIGRISDWFEWRNVTVPQGRVAGAVPRREMGVVLVRGRVQSGDRPCLGLEHHSPKPGSKARPHCSVALPRSPVRQRQGSASAPDPARCRQSPACWPARNPN